MEKNDINFLNLMIIIDQVSQLVGVEKYTLRYWEKKYEEFLKPVRSQTGRRKYTVKDLNKIQVIKILLEEENLTYKGVRLRLVANYSNN
jgi:DNA-binding transcriptional MerR regulator